MNKMQEKREKQLEGRRNQANIERQWSQRLPDLRAIAESQDISAETKD